MYTDSNGVITACTYELNKSVPANAVFTDTDTKVTNTLGTTTKFYVTGTTSATTNTGGQTFDTGVYVSTTAGELVATKFTGALNGTASKATADASGNTITTTYATKTELGNAIPASIGSATQPVYTNASGVITACTYELNKTVPANAVFTDTKVTNTKGNTTKFYLTGTNSASTNTGTQYFDSTIYTTATEGELVAKNFTGLASKATADASGNTITTTYATKTENDAKLDADSANYIKSLSISGKTITYTKGDSTTGTLTT